MPKPLVNQVVAGFEVDFFWPTHGVIIETDGYHYHGGRQAFSDDRDRDLELSLAGFRTHRIADTRIADDPAGVARVVRGLLNRVGTR